MKDYRETVTHADMMMSTDLSANIIWLETYIKTLDQMDAHLHRYTALQSSCYFRYIIVKLLISDVSRSVSLDFVLACVHRPHMYNLGLTVTCRTCNPDL